MEKVFVDTSFLIAYAHNKDLDHKLARQVFKQIASKAELITSYVVLTEYFNGLTKFYEQDKSSQTLKFKKQKQINMIKAIIKESNFMVVEQTKQMFSKDLSLYEKRLDSKYSLTDCSSMLIMKDMSITYILTSDHDFEAEGFNILLKRDGAYIG